MDDRELPLANVESTDWGAVAALAAMAACLLLVPVRREWDSKQVYIGLNNLIAWAHGDLPRPVDARQFAIFQYLTGLPVALLAGLNGAPIAYRLWALLSFAGMGITGWLLWRTGRKYGSDSLGWLLLIVLLSGLAITYVPSTFNELAAMGLTTAFAAAVVGRAGAVACGTLFIAVGLTKEVAAPLMVPLWAAGLWIRRDALRRADVIRHAASLVIAFGFTMVVHASFNLVRYGTVLNRTYLSDEFQTRQWDRRAENFVGLWLAPNGGVVPFWPSIVGLVVVALWIAGRRGAFPRLTWRRIIPAVMVVATVGGFTAGMSAYFSPYGWWCWGPRFYLPWLPAALLVLVRAYPTSFCRAARALLEERGAFEATLLFAVVTALPHVFMVFARPLSVWDFHIPDMQFPRGAEPQQQELHYMRLVYLAWLKWPPYLAIPLIYKPPMRGLILSIVYLTGMVVLLWRARTALVLPAAAAQTSPA